MSVIRSAGLRGFRATVAELGGDAEMLAAACGLPVAALDADDLLVPDARVDDVLELAARTLDCPDLGLRIAQRQDLDMLGPLALAIRNSPTLDDVLECSTRYLYLHARSLRVTVEPDPYGDRGVIAIRYGLTPGLRPEVQSMDLGIAFVHHMIQRLAGAQYGLRSVELSYRPLAPLERYEQFYGVPVRIERPNTALRVPKTLSNRPLSGGNEKLHRLAMAFLAQQGGGPDASLAPQVRAAVQHLIGTAASGIDAVARLLNLHPRTMQRRLAAEGASFANILNDVRRDAAHRYLTTTDLPVSQIASLLGLSEQATLTRSCRRWWGEPPSAIRRKYASNQD
ncbi:AraC family transcriptional regulator [Nocardia panacis]|uniref:AraC family transcriptional regulator n=1 Tax=Nocardia panacis TaxID=2340916 RepID=A0A3A4L8Q2_9NOCA|nr:AraC family transcriptional regulator [Nocardia panacis]RJO79451.1 AraC family transcriptional regulator [Nocardia panacis]